MRDGGGTNHRYDLFEMVLIKDNHRGLAGGVARPSRRPARARRERGRGRGRVRGRALPRRVAAGADRILIDNQTPETVARWCALARKAARPPFLEASGNMRLDTVRAYALAGVDAVSVGALTHSVTAPPTSRSSSFTR